MIKGISGSSHIVVSGGNSSGPYVNSHSGQPMIGMVRYHNSNLEVYDGSVWLTIGGSYVTVELTGSANSAISWAMTKMAEEANLEKMATEHPAVKAAYENVKRAKEQLKGHLALGMDSNSGLMLGLGKSLLLFDQIDTIQEIYAGIDRLTSEEILDIANTYFAPDNCSELIFEVA